MAASQIHTNPLLTLQQLGQSVWLDYIRRSLITSGELKRLIKDDGLRGVTSNPAIFEKAITGSSDYTKALKALEKEKGLDAKARYERLAIQDIQDAADELQPVYKRTKCRDGYVSLEVSPHLARDTPGSIEEARRLWKSVGRRNVMIKVPATPEGIPAIQQLISEGINVNVTLLFSQHAYERVAEAYVSGLHTFAANGGDVSKVASVASFFISRIDTAIDSLISARLKDSTDDRLLALLHSLMGKVAIANAKLTYQLYQQIYTGQNWETLKNKGAMTQRVLWASTSTKNPNYRDVLYVEELIGPETVNTIPLPTFDAFRNHGRARTSLLENVEDAQDTMDTLDQVGISMEEVTEKLLEDALRLFNEPFDKLLAAVDLQCGESGARKVNGQTFVLPKPLVTAVKASLKEWDGGHKVRRLWSHDATLWTGTDEANWLGWLGITADQLAHIQPLVSIRDEIKQAGFSHVMVLGMGGSSLCPEVMTHTFGKQQGYPTLHVLDSTDPAQIRRFEEKIDLAHTLFIVSSKSGGTLEPNIFQQYFFDRVRQTVGDDHVGQYFIAITDPGSKMQRVAEGLGFRHIFYGLPNIGGRYSALSNFGLIPSSVMGIDVPKILDRTEEMVHACSSCVPAEENPALVLGTILGVLANKGRNKVTLITSPAISDLGAWLEQLIAESTGKKGKGLIPVDREALGAPAIYGSDRVFIYVRLETAPDKAQDVAVQAIEQAGQPLVRISVNDIYDVGQEFFRWEMATAVACSIMGVNAFNQPDVEASKLATRKLTSEYEKTGTLPLETPIFEDDGVKLYTDGKNVAALSKTISNSEQSLVGYLKAHVDRLAQGDYFTLLAYIEMNDAHDQDLQAIRHLVRDQKHVATCLGFGPRFLHSTGQAYKGGPDSGVFLQITCDDANDLAVPGQKYTFGVVKAAQARGDFQVLAERGRRVLRIHLGADVATGLATLKAAMEKALA